MDIAFTKKPPHLVFSCWPDLEPMAKFLPLERFSGQSAEPGLRDPSGKPDRSRVIKQGLFYYDYGPQNNSGKPVLILIHGLGDEADTWRYMIKPLGDAGFRVLALDLPGFGRSPTNKRSGIGHHRDAVLKLAEAAAENPDQGFVLIGSSLGAAVAEAAALASSRVKALILIDGCIPVESSGSSQIILSALPFAGPKWYRSFRTNPERAWRSLFSYYGDIQSLSEKDKDFLRERVMDRVCSSSQERAYFSTLRSMIFQSLRIPYYKRIGSWPGEISLIWGEKDEVMPIDVTKSFIKLRGGISTELTIIPGAGHLPHQEKPAETAELILARLRKISK